MEKKYFRIRAREFSVHTDPRTGTPCVHSINPYDETEYHWARKDARGNSWTVYLNGKKVAHLDAPVPISYETVAQVLQNADAAAGLKRRGGIW